MQRPSMPLPIGGMDPTITVQELWEKVQELKKQNTEMAKNIQAMQTTQVHGERVQKFPDPRENHNGQDKGDKADGGEGSKGKDVGAGSWAKVSKAKGKGSAEEETKSKDEFRN